MIQNNWILKGRYVYEAMISVFKRVLDNILEQDDTKNGYEIIKIIKSFYYSTSEGMFVYLINELKTQPIWGNYNFWEKYILLSIRNEIRESKIIYQNKKEKESLTLEVINDKLINSAEVILSFGLSKTIVKKLLLSYWDWLKLDENKKSQILEFIDLYGLSEEEIDEIINQRNLKEQHKSRAGWFGGFGTSALSKMGSFFTGSPSHKPSRRSNSMNREDETKDDVEADRSDNGK